MSTNDRLIGELGYVPLGTTNSTAPMTTHLESVVERLRAQSAELSRWLGPRSAGEPETMTEAADRIEADAATIAELTKALEIADFALKGCAEHPGVYASDLAWAKTDIARDALPFIKKALILAGGEVL